jgi:hypothetical protein
MNNNSSKFDICGALEAYADILKAQGALTGAVESLREHGYNVTSLEAQIQELEFEAADVSSEIVQAFVDMRKGVYNDTDEPEQDVCRWCLK